MLQRLTPVYTCQNVKLLLEISCRGSNNFAIKGVQVSLPPPPPPWIHHCIVFREPWSHENPIIMQSYWAVCPNKDIRQLNLTNSKAFNISIRIICLIQDFRSVLHSKYANNLNKFAWKLVERKNVNDITCIMPNSNLDFRHDPRLAIWFVETLFSQSNVCPWG